MIALIGFQHLFEYSHDKIELIKPYININKICSISIEFLSNSNEILALNSSKLLERIITQYHLEIEFTDDEIKNLCFGLQINVNQLICQSILNSFKTN